MRRGIPKHSESSPSSPIFILLVEHGAVHPVVYLVSPPSGCRRARPNVTVETTWIMLGACVVAMWEEEGGSRMFAVER